MSKTIYLGKNVMKIEERLNQLEEERFVAREPTWVSFNPKLNKETHLKLKRLIRNLKQARYDLDGKYCREYKGTGRLSEW